MNESLTRLKRRIESLKNAPVLTKATAAELALGDALYLLEQLVVEVEQLKKDRG